jgi:HK97 family phage prohead protease
MPVAALDEIDDEENLMESDGTRALRMAQVRNQFDRFGYGKPGELIVTKKGRRQVQPEGVAFRWVVNAEDEKRTVAYTTLEARAAADGAVVEGYAAVFGSPSEPMPFIEYVKRGAFAKTLKDGADVRLLIDHVGVPLARTKSGTLQLTEDERGLYMRATLDPTNPDAQRVLSATKRGDLSQMSFAFRTIKDSWSKDRMTRELREVQLYDVSIVTYPAYEDTVVAVRNRQNAMVATSSDASVRQRQIDIARYR